MKPIPMPVSFPFWQVGGLKITREELRAILGEPHFVQTDSFRTFGGDEDCWAFELTNGDRIGFVLRVPYKIVVLYGDTPFTGVFEKILNIPRDDPRWAFENSPRYISEEKDL